ncbi:rod shape-determining protein MreC [Olsenella urininfantis]|uniref:rod shape-determining protein MreC n=1 Tax=Olsenella urininfantis TaxID=1871033 RepID=UPI00098531C6|nr:rod shape-determining protein MreC [Olsenella urininfantis]
MPFNSNATRPSGLRKSDSDSGARLFVALVALSLVMFTVSVRQGAAGPLAAARNVFMTITSPVRYVGSLVSLPFQGLGNVVSNLTADQETLQELRKKNQDLTARNVELEEAEQTARRLQELLALKSSYSLQSTAARVIAGSVDSWNRTVTLDKGSAAGLAVGMPVSDSAGVIGQIIECGPATSTVRLITDEHSGVSAMIQSSRAQGVLRGAADGTLHLTLISTDQTVAVGDMVVTSGLGGVFPKGLPLGKVTSVNRSDGALYYEIDVEPLSSTENNEEVLVITSLTEGQEADAGDIAAADAQDSSIVKGVSDKGSPDGTSAAEDQKKKGE